MLEWTGERYVPWMEGAEIGYEHLHRYAFATQFVRNKRVLDLASGEGYGSNLLAKTAKQVVGVDIDEQTVRHARNKYIKANLEFKIGSILDVPIKGDVVFDVIVCFEALEHVDDHHKLLSEAKKHLTPNGIFLVSTPNKTLYTDEPHFNNPFHVHELYFDEFKVLLENYFRHVKFLGQRIHCTSNMWPIFPEKQTHSTEFVIERTPQEFVFAQPEKRAAIYLVAVASNAAKLIGGHLSFLVDISNDLVRQRDGIIEKVTAERNNLQARMSALEDQSTNLQSTLEAHQRLLAQKQEQISKLNELLKQKEQRLSDSSQELEKTRNHYARDVARLQSVLAERQNVVTELATIHISHAWKAVTFYYRVRDKLLPEGTFRRNVVKGVFRWALAFRSALKSRKALPASTASTPAISDQAAAHEEQSGNTNQPEQPASEDPRSQTSAPSPADSNGVSGEDDNQCYQAMSDRISALRKSRIANVQVIPPTLISIPETDVVSSAQSIIFPVHDEIQVSIIIPVLNNLKFTLECVTSVMRYSSAVPYEVIVVDDESTDSTEEILSSIPNLIYIRNKKNLGFVRACNLGADRAKGKYLLFLNNDTQVTENWLKPLLDIFKEYEHVGAVGPKILFPDGRLQEAGALVNRDGTSKLIGFADNPDLPRYNYVREVTYCSGACLLLDAKTFRELGGFDVALAPAYCEDWDIAFRLREHGLRVMYNPKSVIVHHLSVTSKDVAPDFKITCVVRNQQKLSEKWQREIDRLNEIRLIAFYLPQFHPIPENDRWWGKGFTDWTNVAKARPNYVGHYQPHIPADLGFYDLRVEEVMDEQAELAQRYGLYGFCYFYYWFAGKRLLDLPLERVIKKNKPNHRFCLAWANENWTRTWDGADHEMLIGQQHSDDDDRAVILDMLRYFRHRDYVHVKGKPLLMVYRTHLFPNIQRTTEIWREECRRQGIGDIYLALIESFENAQTLVDPAAFGFDASVEFPPHGVISPIHPPATLNTDFEGVVHDYREAALKYLEFTSPAYVRFRTVMPSWDNTARRQNNSNVFEYASPGAYQAWLEAVLDETHEQNFGEERIVFINAWNEWGEGNHLEPDKRYGHGFLEATRNARDALLLKREQAFS
ncbi:MAG: glycosyl transferase family 2 [Acidobacteria bacterium]|nr:MAG: glycosyl transferase family 2 [Acidobacteriota bacterium]